MVDRIFANLASTLESGDLVFELAHTLFQLLNTLLLELDDLKQLPHQRRALRVRNIGQQKMHGLILPAAQPICPGLLRSYPNATVEFFEDALIFQINCIES